jgi:hypothetical protein
MNWAAGRDLRWATGNDHAVLARRVAERYTSDHRLLLTNSMPRRRAKTRRSCSGCATSSASAVSFRNRSKERGTASPKHDPEARHDAATPRVLTPADGWEAPIGGMASSDEQYLHESPDRRSRLRARTRKEIKTAALRQIAEHGVEGVSLNAIAKEDLGMTGAALYH